ncbi:hypothetical protein CSB93_1226 [Pseudomonas paraeruginosa]|uniref:Uncharacterized protein n=1 Tax=Pseudomonas paraeruginosa TaxID=2994495 RepID=A0A2R3IRC0_9PSED|nr:hypothetical protein CSB93_1226 [Pseudomonas paraeruginosa]AWE92107.1 hypothetical protein CSC28_6541 [Pseudomonas paraeruginosa]
MKTPEQKIANSREVGKTGGGAYKKIKGKECLYLFRACVYYLARPFLLITR